MLGSDDAAAYEVTSRTAVASVTEFLGGPSQDGDAWQFQFGQHLESNWGAVYAGAIGAGMVSIARCAAPLCSPRAMHLQLVRSLPRGAAYATAEVRHAGRTVTTVEVDLFDGRRKLAAIALVTMVTPSAVATQYHEMTATPFDVRTTPFEVPPHRAPMQESLHTLREEDGVYLRAYDETIRPNVDGTTSPIGTITVPWENLELTGPEVSCLAADPMVATAVLQTFVPAEVLGPNPDLSLRFTTAPATRVVLTSGTVLSVQRGTATVAIEVHAGDQHLAHGLGTSLLLARE